MASHRLQCHALHALAKECTADAPRGHWRSTVGHHSARTVHLASQVVLNLTSSIFNLNIGLTLAQSVSARHVLIRSKSQLLTMTRALIWSGAPFASSSCGKHGRVTQPSECSSSGTGGTDTSMACPVSPVDPPEISIAYPIHCCSWQSALFGHADVQVSSSLSTVHWRSGSVHGQCW